MTNGIRRIWLASLACSALFLGLANTGQAATTIGSSLTDPPNDSTCAFATFHADERPCTASQLTLSAGSTATGGLVAPFNGVIVRWRVLSGAADPGTAAVTLSLRTIQGSTGGAAQTPVVLPLALPGLHVFESRLPIRTGESIGVTSRVTNNGTEMASSPIISTAPSLGLFNRFEGALVQGSTGVANLESNREVLLNADVERDADGDGFGDETQDACPTSPSSQLPCPAPGDVTAPKTKLTYPPRQDFLDSHKVVVRLRSNEAATAIASGQLEIGSGPPRKTGRVIYGVTGVKRQVKAKKKIKLVLRVPGKTREAAERALANGKKVVVKVTATATDAAGNRSGATVAVIRPKP